MVRQSCSECRCIIVINIYPFTCTFNITKCCKLLIIGTFRLASNWTGRVYVVVNVMPIHLLRPVQVHVTHFM